MAVEFNLAQLLESVAGVVPDREALAWGDRRFTFGELAERARRFASFLHGRGFGVHTAREDLAGHESGQDHLALYLYNGNEYLEAMLGAFRARVAPFNVNYRYVRDELQYLLADSGARGIVYHSSFAPVLGDVLATLPAVELLVQVDDGAGNELLPGAVDYESVVAAGDPAGPPVDPSPDDLYILYTGGTTGMPKGVLWRQHDIFVAAMGGRAVADYDAVVERARGGGMRCLLLPPLMHGAAQWISLSTLNGGGSVVFPRETRQLEPRDVWDTVEAEQPLMLSVVGDAMLRPLLAELERQPADLASLRAVVSGGAPLHPTLKEKLTAMAPNVMILDAVGSSETGAQMSQTHVPGQPAPNLFTPGPGTVVLDEEMRTQLAPGAEEIGWLAQEGSVPLGYLGDAGKTARTFPVVEGVRYAVPGDRARLLADGRIELLGRDSVTINTGGEKVFAEEVERAIGAHDGVDDVVVVGRPSEQWGQEIVALVQRAEGSEVGAEELVAQAAQSLARYKLPKAVVFVPTVVRSPSGKADYRWAAQRALE
jgi:acyl-CoA synthetase (AMP-forming)/AMP-acid ligase II